MSTFHEPQPALSPWDPWWLAGLAALALLLWRTLLTLARRQEEAAYWVLAAVSYAPISQVFPFRYPMADRYLYAILPGLIGGLLLAGRAALARIEPKLRVRFDVRPTAPPMAGALALATGALLAVYFAAQSRARAAVFRSDLSISIDAAANYPNGITANHLRARRAARAGDPKATAAALKALRERGYAGFRVLLADPAIGPVSGEPEVRAEIVRMADFWIEQFGSLARPTLTHLRSLAQAHVVRDEPAAALSALDRALEHPHLDEKTRVVVETQRHRLLRQLERGGF